MPKTSFNDDGYTILVIKITLIIELLCVLGNLILFIFHYITIRNEIMNRKNNKKQTKIDPTLIILTHILLFFGFCFSIFEGILNNWILNDCSINWLSWITFTLYILHRLSILFIFLNRLYTVFNNTIYQYSIIYIIILAGLIILYGILSLYIYNFDHEIIKINIKWNILNHSNIVCTWKFGNMVNC